MPSIYIYRVSQDWIVKLSWKMHLTKQNNFTHLRFLLLYKIHIFTNSRYNCRQLAQFKNRYLWLNNLNYFEFKSLHNKFSIEFVEETAEFGFWVVYSGGVCSSMLTIVLILSLSFWPIRKRGTQRQYLWRRPRIYARYTWAHIRNTSVL